MTDKDRNSTALKKFMALAPAICALVSALAQTGLQQDRPGDKKKNKKLFSNFSCMFLNPNKFFQLQF